MITILNPGLLTSVQDLGRTGFLNQGIGQSGVLDHLACRVANLLVKNSEDNAVLEITMGSFRCRFEQDCWFALTGADCDAHLEQTPVWNGWQTLAKKGQTLTLNAPKQGCRTYLAVNGGFDVPVMMGSKSTDLKAQFGGYQGRPLKKGDTIAVGSFQIDIDMNNPKGIRQLPYTSTIRVLCGPEFDEFTPTSQEQFWQTPWKITPQSNRMGFRLEGCPLERQSQREMLSHGLAIGTIQVPHGGQPIILMSDAQTTGGYPRIAKVIEADLPSLAQIRLGEYIHFEKCLFEDAIKAFHDVERYISTIKRGLYEN